MVGPPVVWYGWMSFTPDLKHESEAPLYRQLYAQYALKIRSGEFSPGQRMPATRELAGLLGLNRATIAAAYEMLEAEGLIAGHAGRGSFVTGGAAAGVSGVDWNSLLEPGEAASPDLVAGMGKEAVSFAMSRPSRDLFPLEDFRASCAAVLARRDLPEILQLGSPSGYEPLRRRLLDDARRAHLAGPGDDLIVTNGCQQGLDLIARVLVRPGDQVILEDPVYPGQRNLFAGMGAQLLGIPVGADGLNIGQLERTLERGRTRLLAVTPNFQNPTGATLPLAARGILNIAGTPTWDVSTAAGAAGAAFTGSGVPFCIGGGGEMRAEGRAGQQRAADFYWEHLARRPSYFQLDGKPLLLVDTDKTYGPGDFEDARFTVRWVYNGDNHAAMARKVVSS